MRVVTQSGRQARVAGMSQPYSHEGSKRVYVGNLDWSVTWQDLKDHMKLFGGQVLHAEVMQFPDGKSKGCGIVEFGTSQDAATAITRLQDSELKGRKLFLREDREGPNPSPSQSQFAPTSSHVTYVDPFRVVTQQPISNFSAFQGNMGHHFPGSMSNKPAAGMALLGHTGAVSQKVVVENLPSGYSWQNLKDLMKVIGPVRRADVVSQPNGTVVGVVEFIDDEDAHAAINMYDRQLVDGNVITLHFDNGSVVPAFRSSSIGVGKRLFVGSLAWEVAWQDLKDHFKTIGPVVRADVSMESSGRSRGFGFVEFEDSLDAARAIAELNDSMLRGRRINVREDREEL